MSVAATLLTPVVLEIGGKCSIVVDSNVNLKVSTRRIVSGKWRCNNGKACIAPDYFTTLKSIPPTLVDPLKDTLGKFYGEEPLKLKDVSCMYHFARIACLLDGDKVCNKIVYGGKCDKKCLQIFLAIS